MRATPLLLSLAAAAWLPTPAPAQTPAELAAKAKQVLDAHCHRCHGKSGAVEGGMNYAADLPKLAARKKVVAGNPEASPVFRRVANGTMPPPDEKPRPTEADVAALKAWIAAGAPGSEVAPPPTTVSAADVQAIILSDLEKMERRSRRFQRYFTLTHLLNAGLGDDELQTYRNALAKLINSLSWHPTIRNPEPIDPARTVFRIDLRWYMWDAVLWNQVLDDYPYGTLDDSATARAVMIGTATRMPAVRGDWFVATASRAPLYYDLLQMPGNLAELERQLRVDANLNIQQERVVRVGFNGSGISRSNRILERHDAVHGAYWRTYDFEEVPQNLIERADRLQSDRRNVFAHPLGPGLVAQPFTHAGGEAIFALPNGLHGYYLVNAVNARLDKGPIQIVSDPKRPDRAVEAGVSCMGCHVTGILPKADQVREHVEKNPGGFSRAEAELVRALYPPKDKTLAVMEEDAKKFAEAVAKTGGKVARFEAVSTITLRYEADMDLPAAAAEVGLTAEAFKQKIAASEVLAKNLGGLQSAGGTVSRAVWVQAFGDLTRELNLGTLFVPNGNGSGILPDNTGEVDPLEAQGNTANAVAFLPGGKRMLVASADRGVRLWDVEGRRELKVLAGHSASVWAVAVSADGKRGASGSVDGTVRVWDLVNPTELKRLDGHVGLVSAVALTPDGAKVLSGGFDGAVIWWDAVTGKELRRLEGEAKYVHSVDLNPAKKLAAIAADRGVILWNYATGEVVKRWPAHDAAATCVRFAEGGAVLLTGGDDGKVKVWDATTGELVATLTGHEGGVRGLELKPGGRWLASAGADRTVRLWDLATRAEVAAFRKHGGPVLGVAFAPSGTKTLSADRDLNALLWGVEKFLTGDGTTVLVKPPPPDAIPPVK